MVGLEGLTDKIQFSLRVLKFNMTAVSLKLWSSQSFPKGSILMKKNLVHSQTRKLRFISFQ